MFRSLLVAAMSSALAAACLAAAPVSAAERLDTTHRTVVMTAFEPEWNALAPDIQDPTEFKLNGMQFLLGTLEGKPVLLMTSGVSVVNSAMNTQLVLDHFAVKRIIFSGIAGGVDPSLNIGDVLIANEWGQYLEVSYARWTDEGWVSPEPVDPAAPKNWEFMFPRGVRVGNADEAPKRHYFFPVDAQLLKLAETLTPSLKLERCVPHTGAEPPASELCLPQAPKIVIGGIGVSAGVFADNAQMREYLFRDWNARILDMESAAVAQVAYANQVPAIFIRSLSDLAGGDHETNLEETFKHLAAVNSARVLRAYLAILPD